LSWAKADWLTKENAANAIENNINFDFFMFRYL
jgi:hypothetical protein